MSTLHNRANWGRALVPDLTSYIIDGFKQLPDYVAKIFNISSMDRAYEEEKDGAGITKLEKMVEGGSASEANRQDGYLTRYTAEKFGGKLRVTQEMFEDDQYGLFNDDAKQLGKALTRTTNENGFSMFNNGFDTAFTSYGDNKPLFSTSHTRPDGGTAQSNASAEGILFNETNLFTGLDALRKQLDQRGQLLDIGLRPLLLIPRTLEKSMTHILKSELRSDTSNNDINFYKGVNMDALVCPWIGAETSGGSDEAWYLMARGEHKLNFKWRKRPTITSWTDNETDDLLTKLVTRFTYGWSNWRGVWGSKGDGQAYTS